MLWIEWRDTWLRNAALIGLGGGEDTDIEPDSHAEFDDVMTPAPRQTAEERRAQIAQLAAG